MTLNLVEECYVAAFIYALRLIDEKAEQRGELVLPEQSIHDHTYECLPKINWRATCSFVHKVGDQIANAHIHEQEIHSKQPRTGTGRNGIRL